MSALLEVENLSVRHGQLLAVSELSLVVTAGQVVAVIGANGAGRARCWRRSPVYGTPPTAGSCWTART